MRLTIRDEFMDFLENKDPRIIESVKEERYPYAGYNKIIDYLYQRVLFEKPEDVLIIGIGDGFLSRQLEKEGINITGVDFDRSAMEGAEDRLDDAELIPHNFSKSLPESLKDRQFDIIIVHYAIKNLSTAEQIHFLEEIKTLLKEDGTLYFSGIMTGTREEMRALVLRESDQWNAEENYLIYELMEDEIDFDYRKFIPFSYCSGILILRN